MERIRIGVVRSRRYRSQDGYQVYGDGGTGVVDWSVPVTSRWFPFWPDAPVQAGHVEGGHLAGVHLDAVRPDGHLEGTFLLDEHLRPATAMGCELGPFVFGRFRHAVVTEDVIGNAEQDGVTIHETVINAAPPPAADLVPIAFDGMSGRLTFRFTPSDRLTG